MNGGTGGWTEAGHDFSWQRWFVPPDLLFDLDLLVWNLW